MFPDSAIAKSFSCGRDKIGYLLYFGISPYFHQLLYDHIRTVSNFVILFDETLNKVTQSKQMDLHFRYWNESNQRVITRYYGSIFLGHATADIMKAEFMAKCSNLNLNRLLQLSMDGPNVNWSFYNALNKEIFGEATKAVDLGSCGLHILHNSFKAGFEQTSWHLDSFLRSLYTMFHDVPARRDDFIAITGTNIFPMKFCAHRWIENARVAERAQAILPDVIKYCETVSKPKGQYKSPSCKSFETVKEACLDPLLPSKLALFECIARNFNEFLVLFQVDKPMVPFLTTEISKLLLDLCRRFMKKDLLKADISQADLAKILPIDEKNHVTHSAIDIGFAAEKKLKTLLATKKISEKQIISFRLDAKKCFMTAASKIVEKSPLKYTIARLLNCLDPRTIATNKEKAEANFKRVLHKLSDLHHISEQECDIINKEFINFLSFETVKDCDAFRNFSIIDERLDTFYAVRMNSQKQYANVYEVIKKLLILSHGQATVERGFSVNEEIIVENLRESSVEKLRIVYGALNFYGGVTSVEITKPLLISVRGARQRYRQHLEEVKKNKTREKISSKNEKRKSDNELECVKKRKLLANDITNIEDAAKELVKQAEVNRDFTLVLQANALFSKATEKKAELQELGQGQ